MSRKSRLKKYVVKLLLYHESYNGYDHCDGTRDFEVEAQNEVSAIKKAERLVPNHQWSKKICTTVTNLTTTKSEV